MDRRQFSSHALPVLAAVILLAQPEAQALSIDDLSHAEASQGLKAALEKGARAAVSALGRTDGFLGNEKVRIPLPGYLEISSSM